MIDKHIEQNMEIATIKETGKCCVCDAPLADSHYLNAINVNVKAAWSYPVWGNFLTDVKNMACAYICDGCFDRGHEAGEGEILPIKNVVEFGPFDSLIYHPLTIIDGKYQLVPAPTIEQ